jgi:hypothetical protein
LTLVKDGLPYDIINTGHNFCGVKDLKDQVLSRRVSEDFLRQIKEEAAAAPDSLKPVAEVLVSLSWHGEVKTQGSGLMVKT